MTQNKEVSIADMNEAICNFMGGYRQMGDIDIYKGPDEIEWEDGTYLKYHSDWNQLMKVVEKIRKLATAGNAINGITENKIFSFSIFAPLEDTYNAVFEFITWYNTTLKK